MILNPLRIFADIWRHRYHRVFTALKNPGIQTRWHHWPSQAGLGAAMAIVGHD
jgi:hypothetical protein